MVNSYNSNLCAGNFVDNPVITLNNFSECFIIKLGNYSA